MSYFLFVAPIAIKRKSSRQVPGFFEFPISCRDVTDGPIGQAILGQVKSVKAYAVLSNHSATDIVRRPKKGRDARLKFLTGLNSIFQFYGGVSVILHWCSGAPETDPIQLRRSTKSSLADVINRFPEIEDDVRYQCIFP